MTLQTDDDTRTYANPSGTTFNGPPAFVASTLFLYVVESDGVTRTLIPSSDYTVTQLGRNLGTRIVLDAPIASPSGKTLLIQRTVPYNQLTDITNQGDFNAQVLEGGLDTLGMQTQQLARQVGRALRFPDNVLVDFDPVIPTPLNPLDILQVRPDGLGFVLSPAPAIATVANGAITDDKVSPIAGIQGTKLQFIQGGTGAILRNVLAKQRERVSVLDFGAVGDGTINDAPSINAAITYMNSIGGGIVDLVKGATYLVDSAVLMKAGVVLDGKQSAIITQRNGQNLQELIEFGISAHHAAVRDVIVDGNRANNPDGIFPTLIHGRGSNDIEVSGCILRNSTGWAILTNSVRNVFDSNVIDNVHTGGIGLYNSTGSSSTDAYHRITNNRFTGLGGGAINIGDSNYATVRGNKIIGTQVGGRNNRIIINMSGTTVTRVSGPDFANVKPGMYLVTVGGAEYKVVTVNSVNSLTTETSGPGYAGVQATVGTGDMLAISGSAFCDVSDNVLYGGATFGMGFVVNGTWPTSHNKVSENLFINNGKNSINMSPFAGTGALVGNAILNNRIVNACSSANISTLDRCAILLFDETPTRRIFGTVVDGNHVFSDTGDGQTQYWLGTNGSLTFGDTTIGVNSSYQMGVDGIYLDVTAAGITGWGTTSGVSNVISRGNSVTATIAATGTGQAASALLSITKQTSQGAGAPVLVATAQTAGGTITPMQIDPTTTNVEWKVRFSGTPAAGETYTIRIISRP